MIEGIFINLERSVERRAAIEAQLADIDLRYPVHRLEAIDGRQRTDCPPGLSPPQHGCWLSHVEALRRFGATGQHLHIMEDDALLSPALAALPDIVQAAERGGDWDILYLDATLVEIADMVQVFEWARAARAKATVQVHPIPREFTVYGTHAYVVNGRRKSHVLDFVTRHMGRGKPYDNVLAHGIQRGELRALLTSPFISSGSELTLARTLADRTDESYLAWLLFRRLCFWDLEETELAELGRRGATLRDVGPQETLLGQLVAYRVARWPMRNFPPGL